jgi:hypothetical protein
MTESHSDTRKRFPRIFHIVNGPLNGGGVTRDDVILSGKEADNFFDVQNLLSEQPQQDPSSIHWSVVVQEKIDGANMGIFYDVDSRSLAIQNRSHRVVANSGSQWKGLDKWLEATGSEILQLLFALPTIPQLKQLLLGKDSSQIKKTQEKNNDGDDDEKEKEQEDQSEQLAGEWTLYGEWVLARHSIGYDSLPAPFLAFDIHHAPTDTFLATEVVSRLLQKYCPSIQMVPLLKQWKWNDDATTQAEAEAVAAENNNDNNNKSNKNKNKMKKSSFDAIIPISWDQVHRVYHGQPSKFILAAGNNNASACCEGAMIRLDVNGTLLRRCKAVHDHFRANIEEHWTAKEMVKNGLVNSSM